MSHEPNPSPSPAPPSALAADRVADELKKLTGWERHGNEIVKTFHFTNYYQTLAFVNATAWISHHTDHHPDLEVGYNKVRVRYSTHDAGGISQSDFTCAAAVDKLLAL